MKSNLNKDWQRVLASEINSENYTSLSSFLQKERSKHPIFPPKELIFSALNLCSLKETQIVLLGQDPYHKVGQAQGLAFSTTNSQKRPPSLRNIFKELEDDLGIDKEETNSLDSWARQGVLLLNTCLTVQKGNPLSHTKIGWDKITHAVLKAVALKKSPVVFLLWGKQAQKSCQFLSESLYSQHHILKASHPSPLSSKGFFGCKHFSQVNNFLLSIGKEPIIW